MKQRIGLQLLHWLRFWSRLQLRKYAPDIIGITGSAGKTSCRDAVQAILDGKYQLKVTGKANSESGIPMDILGIGAKDFSPIDWLRIVLVAPIKLMTNWQPYEKYIVEMAIDSPNPPKNMSYLLTLVRPRTAIFLNALPVHSQPFDSLVKGKDRRNEIIRLIALEKGKLIESLPANGLAILNGDQPEVAAFAAKTKAQVMTFGMNASADIRIGKIDRNKNGTTFEFSDGDDLAVCKLPYLLPDYYASTLAAALCINADEGNSLAEGCELLTKNFKLEPGRMSVFEGINGSTIIDSSYNASAEPTIGALSMLADLPAKRRLAVLGAMNELGEETEMELKLVKETADRVCDQVWWAKGTEAVNELKQLLKPGDYVLIKGSQNRVFLELTVEALLAHKTDAQKLCRRGEFWETQRKKMLE